MMADMMIPEGWKNKTLDEVATVFAGGTPSRSNQTYYDGGIPWVKSGEVNKRFVYYTEETISELAVQESSARWAKSGSVLIAMYGATAGKVAKLMIDATLNQAVSAINGKSKMANNDFLFYAIENKSQELLNTVQGSGQPNLSGALIKSLNLAIPPLPEQQKIATILSSVDIVIEKTRAQIDKLKDLKTGMMQELLTKGIGHTEYKDTPVGRIPKTWEIQNINGLVTKVGSGVTPRGGSAAYVRSGVPLIRSQNVYSDGLRLEDVAYITAEQHNKMANSQLKPNDVLLNITGASIGRCHYLPSDFKEGNVNQHVCIIRPKQSAINSAFLAYLLNSELGQRQIMSLQAGGNREGLNFQQIREISFATPTLPEQQKIVNVLQSIDTKIMTASQKLNSVEQTKKALMQDLLTGKVRVEHAEK